MDDERGRAAGGAESDSCGARHVEIDSTATGFPDQEKQDAGGRSIVSQG